MIRYGHHAVVAVLQADPRRVDELLVARESRRRPLYEALAREAGVRWAAVPREALTALAGTPHHQGVVARVAARPYVDLEALAAIPATRGEPGWLLALDRLQDPGNVGNLLRTAEALGVHGVLLPLRQAAGLTPQVARAAAGALERLPVARVVNLPRALLDLKARGYRVVGTAAPSGRPPWELDLRGPLVLVLGSEGRGLRRLVSQVCDTLTWIPLPGGGSSLNVAAAGAILLYEAGRQRYGQAP